MPIPRIINLNDAVPIAPTGRANVRWQGDDLDPRNVSAYALIGGVNAQTSNVAAIVSDDHGRLVTLSNAGAVAVSLPAANTLPDGFWLLIENLGAGTATLTPTTSTIDGAASLALTQHQGCAIFSDGANYWTMRGIGGGSGGLSGVNSQAADYTALAGDNGKLVVMTKATAKTLTLPAAPPSSTWAIFVQNIGAGLLTVNRNGLLIDNVAADLSAVQTEGVAIFTDGSNYFTERGWRGATRAAATINAGTLAAGASATGSIALCRSGKLLKVVAAAKSRLRLYMTAAGRDADAGRAYGNALTPGCGELVEIAWTLGGTAPLTYPMNGAPALDNDDTPQATTIYWAATNNETSSTAITFDLTYEILVP